MTRVRIVLTVALALGLSSAACGGAAATGVAEPGEQFQSERVHEAAGVRLWIPPAWRVDAGQDDTLVLRSPQDDLGITLFVVDGQDLGTALLAAGAQVIVAIDDLELVGSPTSVDINGMPALFQDGRGTRGGVAVEVSLGVIETPAKKYLMVLGAADAATLHHHEATLVKVMENIRPM